MRARFIKLLKIGALLFTASVVTLLAVRAFDSQRGAPLALWHTYAPHELTAQELATANWDDYLARSARSSRVCARVNVTQKLDPEDQVPANRYFEGSPIYPGHFATDWNRSYILEPEGTPVGAVVFLHGLTDSPYSLRHVARLYQSHGFVSVAIRLPGHGTVPAGLTNVVWEDWSPRRIWRCGKHGGGSANVALAYHRILQRRCVGDEIRARHARRSEADPSRSDRADFADDRDHGDGPVRWDIRLAGDLSALCEGCVAQRGAGIQSIQIQLVPDQWRPAIVIADARPATPDCPVCE